MADNTELDAGAGGDTIASDDIGGVKYQRVKLIEGADGVNDGDISAANPLPVTEASAAAIKTAVELIDNAIAGTEMQVDIVADGAGLATTAKQDTAAAILTTIDADTGAIKTAVEKIDDAIAGNEMQVDVITQPVRDRTTDNQGVALQTDAIMDDTTALTPVHLNINGNNNGNNTILAAQNGFYIRILALALSAHGNVNVIIENGAAGADLIGPLAFDADTQPKGLVLPFNPVGWHQTSDNTLLNMALDAAVVVAGVVVYVLVPV